jgi:hypothetical protein
MFWEFSNNCFEHLDTFPISALASAYDREDYFHTLCDAFGFIPVDHLPYCDWSPEGIRVARIDDNTHQRSGFAHTVRSRYRYIVEFCPIDGETHYVLLPSMPDWVDFLNKVHSTITFNLVSLKKE